METEWTTIGGFLVTLIGSMLTIVGMFRAFSKDLFTRVDAQTKSINAIEVFQAELAAKAVTRREHEALREKVQKQELALVKLDAVVSVEQAASRIIAEIRGTGDV